MITTVFWPVYLLCVVFILTRNSIPIAFYEARKVCLLDCPKREAKLLQFLSPTLYSSLGRVSARKTSRPRANFASRSRLIPKVSFFAFMVTFFNFISRRFSLISTTRPTGAERIKNKQLFYTSRIARYGFSFLQCPGDGVSVVKQFYERKRSSDFIFIIAGL